MIAAKHVPEDYPSSFPHIRILESKPLPTTYVLAGIVQHRDSIATAVEAEP
jgi:hypothetical protein